MPGANAIVLPAGASLEHTIATQAVHTNFGTDRRREAAMDYTTLGRTGLRVSVAGLGAVLLAASPAGAQDDPAAAVQANLDNDARALTVVRIKFIKW